MSTAGKQSPDEIHTMGEVPQPVTPSPSQPIKEAETSKDEQPDVVTGESHLRQLFPYDQGELVGRVRDALLTYHRGRRFATPAGKPALKRLAWLDKLLAVWIILAMAVGIILGEFVPQTSVVLEKVKFVDVSLPLGAVLFRFPW